MPEQRAPLDPARVHKHTAPEIASRKRAAGAVPIAMLTAYRLPAYSVLSHEAIIDDSWNPAIRPLLLKRFPGATEDDLHQAHAFAYGGAIIQDMGYYPLGSKFFSDLTHYVRSGDFILALLRDSQNLNEYAFALGAAARSEVDGTYSPGTASVGWVRRSPS